MVDHDRELLSRTSSLCPVCLERVEASIIAEEAEVFLEKSCKDHGSWKTAIWRGLPRYEDWVRPKAPLYPETVYGEVRRGCPFDCNFCSVVKMFGRGCRERSVENVTEELLALKPSNVFILDNGQVRLLDFGFAKFTRMRPLTLAGMAAGSPSYIAPEIWRDAPLLDQRIDVYSLGAIMFRALAGRPPFVSADLSELLMLVTTAPRPSLHELRPDLHPRIDDWVQHALAAAPGERFSSVRALYNAFGSLVV